jgi:hypothetical protein
MGNLQEMGCRAFRTFKAWISALNRLLRNRDGKV